MNIKKSIITFASLFIYKRNLNSIFFYNRAKTIFVNDTKPDYLMSSNNIICCKTEKTTYYFKECRKHIDRQGYINEVILDFFSTVVSEINYSFIQMLIFDDLKRNTNVKKVFKIDKYADRDFNLIKNAYQGQDLKKLGFPSLHKKYIEGDGFVRDFLDKQGNKFLWYIRNEVMAYKLHKGRVNQYQIIRPFLSLATKELANMLGIAELIPEYCFVKLRLPGQSIKFGIITEKCIGVAPLTLSSEKKNCITPNFQKQLSILNFFDSLCLQKDHKLENYYVLQNNSGEITNLTAFDNDSPITFYPYPFLQFKTSVLCSPVCKKGKFNRPQIDKQFANNVLNLHVKFLFKSMKKYLSIFQNIALCLRLVKLKKLIRFNQNKIISEWSYDTIKIELEGNYGKTYLLHYLYCDENQLINDLMGIK